MMWGPRRQAPNPQAILVAGLKPYRSAIVACFVLGGKLGAALFGTFATLSTQSGESLKEGPVRSTAFIYEPRGLDKSTHVTNI
jgi:hypothetical protein